MAKTGGRSRPFLLTGRQDGPELRRQAPEMWGKTSEVYEPATRTIAGIPMADRMGPSETNQT